MKKRFLCLALVLVMLVGIIPFSAITAFAASGTGSENDPLVVTTYAELKTLMAEAPTGSTRYIKLGANITEEDASGFHYLVVPNAGQNVVLDLAGYSITRNSRINYDKGVIHIENGNLTIKDSVGTGGVFFGDNHENAIYSHEMIGETEYNGKLVIEGGTYAPVNESRTDRCSAIYLGSAYDIDEAAYTIKGGTFKGNYALHVSDGSAYVYGGSFYQLGTDDLFAAISFTGNILDQNKVFNCIAYGDMETALSKNLWDVLAYPDGTASEVYIDGVKQAYSATAVNKWACTEKIEIKVNEEKIVSGVNISIDEPVLGASVPDSAIAPADAKYSITEEGGKQKIVWYKDASVFNDATFTEVGTYRLRVYVSLDEGCAYANDATFKINGHTARLTKDSAGDYLEMDFAIDPTYITEINITIDEPTLGGVLPKSPTVPANAKYSVSGATWYKDSIEQTRPVFLSEGAYSFNTFITLDDNYALDEGVVVKVNGKTATLGAKSGDSYRVSCNFDIAKSFNVVYTADSSYGQGDTLTVDVEAMKTASADFATAYANGKVSYQWYADHEAIPGATTEKLFLGADYGNKMLYVAVMADGKGGVSEQEFGCPYVTSLDIIITPAIVGETPATTAIEKNGKATVTNVKWLGASGSFTGSACLLQFDITLNAGYSYKTFENLDEYTEFFKACMLNGKTFSNDGGTNTVYSPNPETVKLQELITPYPAHTHGGGTATCEAKAVCSTCGISYGEIGTHSFTQKIADEAHLVAGTGETCQDAKKYYYDCAYCAAISTTDTWTSEEKGAHTFTEKLSDAAHLVEGTGTNCQEKKEYYFDCVHCNEIGTAVAPWVSEENGAHVYTQTVVDSDHLVSGSGANCQDAKKYYYDCIYCDSIGTTATPWVSDEVGAHSFDTSAWGYKGADGHGHKCTVSGCDEVDSIVGHTSSGAATEQNAETCTDCGYTITPALGHTTHTPKADWKSDGEYHWHECTGCEGQQLDKAAHTPNADDGDCTTEITCSVCGETTTAASTHTDTDTDGKCDTCGKDMPTTPDPDPNPNPNPNPDPAPTPDPKPSGEKDGLPTGAIIAIVAGSVVVGGAGIFALVWFVIKKKTWAEFLVIFKKG